MLRFHHAVFAISIALGLGHPALARTPNVKVEAPWARSTVPGQQAGGAFMSLTSDQAAALTGAESPVADRVEIHATHNEQGVMKMRAAEKIDLPPGKTVSLAPGGYHLMLMGLKRPLKAGEKLPLTIRVTGNGQAITTIRIEAEIRPATESAHHHH